MGDRISGSRKRGGGAGLRRGGRRGGDRLSHRLYAHLSWGTLGGLPLVDRERADLVEGHLITLARRLGTEPVVVRARRDGVHVLLRFHPGQELGLVARRLKSGSETRLREGGTPIRWARALGLVSVAPGEIRELRRRIDRRARRSMEAAAGASSRASPPDPVRRRRG